MKYLLLLTTLLHSSFSYSYTSKIDFDDYKFQEIKKSNSLIMGGMGKLKKKAPKKSSYIHTTSNYKYFPRKTHLSVTNVESSDPRFLKVRIDSKKIDDGNLDKYEAFKVLYNLKSSEDFSSFTGEGDVEVINGERFITLDIFPLEPGDYIASLQVQAYKSQHKNKKSVYTFNLSFSFERPIIQSAVLVANNYQNLAGNAAVYFDTSESYSEFGEITGFRYETYLNGELKEDNVTQFTFTNAVIRFREVGNWTIKITAIDSLGSEDSQEFNFNVTNTVPSIVYSYTLDPNVAGHLTIDLSQSSDPDGIIRYETFYYKVNDDGSLVYWKYLPHGETVTTNLVNRGQNYICARVTDSTGAFDVQCFYIEFNQNIAPYHFFNFYEPVDYDVRTWYFESFCFDNDGSPAKYNFRATTTFNGEEFVVEQESTGSGMDITFPRPGEWNIESTCMDNDGAVSNVNRITDYFDFDLGEPEVYLDFFSQNGLSTDLVYNLEFFASPSPYADSITAYDLQITDLATNNVVIRETYTSPVQTVTLPKASNYEVLFRVTDNLGIDSFIGSFTFKINAAPIADFIINKVGTKYTEYEVINNSSDDQEITSIDIIGSLGAEEKFAFENKAQYYPLTLNESGLWSIRFIVTDNQNAVTEQTISVNVVNQAPIANFNVTQDPGNKFNFTFNSVSSDDGPIVKYILKTDDMVIEHFSETFNYVYNTTGDQAVEIIVIDDGGNQSSWTTTINIENEKPIAIIGLSTDPPNTKLLKINSESTDSDGQIVEYFFRATNYDTGAVVEGRYPEVGTIPNFTVELDYGYWNVSVIVVDNAGTESDPYVQDFEIIDLRPIANFSAIQEIIPWNRISLNASSSIAPAGFIINYNYIISNQDGDSFELNTNQSITSYDVPSAGTYTIALNVMDNLAQVSETIFKTIEVIDTNIAPIANFELIETQNFGQYQLVNNSTDSDGSIEKIRLAASSDQGDIINETYTDLSNDILIDLTQAKWDITLYAIDDFDKESAPQLINIDLSNVEEFISIISNKVGTYSYSFDLSGSLLEENSTLNFKVLFDGSELYFDTLAQNTFTLDIFNKNGIYTIEAYTLNQGVQNTFKSISLNVVLPNINGDTIPDDPGIAGFSTLEGIDSDGDGVRDDVELFINSNEELSLAQKVQFKKISLVFNNQLLNSSDPSRSIANINSERLRTVCLTSSMSREKLDLELRKLKAKYFNTGERLKKYIELEKYIVGTDEFNPHDFNGEVQCI